MRLSGQRLTLLGLVTNVGLAMVKLIAGLLGHSYALVADAVESMADILGSMVVLGGLRVAAQPPDAKHPYGHGKAEALAAFIVAVMLLAAGLGIAVAAVREIVIPHHAPAAFTLWVLVAVVVVKEALYRLGRRVHDSSGSGAVLADAWHHRSDAITSLAAGIGISIALIGGPAYAPADDVAALFASAIVLYNGWRLLMPPMHELLDAEQPELIDRVRSIAEGVEGVRGVEKALARKSGTWYWVDMHVEVDPDMTVHDAHEVAHRVKDAVRAAELNVRDVLIHIEPFRGPRRDADAEAAESMKGGAEEMRVEVD